jgi:hypothetical protein
MNWWLQPFFQEALPIMIAIAVGTWYQCRKIKRNCESIDRWIAENDRRMEAAKRRPGSA